MVSWMSEPGTAFWRSRSLPAMITPFLPAAVSAIFSPGMPVRSLSSEFSSPSSPCTLCFFGSGSLTVL